MATPPLKLFTDADITRHVGIRLLARFFARFTHLLPPGSTLPRFVPENDFCYEVLARKIERPGYLPDALMQALHEIEATVSTLPPPRPCDITHPDETMPFLLRTAIQLWLAASARTEASLTNPSIHESNNPTPSPPPSSILHPPSSSDADSSAFSRLARLSPAEYERARHTEARRLHLRVRTLDAEVAKCRAELALQDQANAVHFPEIEPWPDPVDAAQVLADVFDRYALQLFLPPGAPDALALWTAHSHAYSAFHQTPRLNLLSPHGGCGKTTTLDILTTLVPRPLRAESLSAAVLFRLVDQHQPILLLDEVDTYLKQSEELRGLLNAGHKRGARAYRCEGEGNAVRAFNAFAPAVLAGIGSLPATLHDRSILIPLVPAEDGQIRVRFDPLHTDIETTLARKLARWAQDNFDALAACKPSLPPGAFNRLADNWRPLLAVAQVAGGDWPARALDAFAKLTPKPAARPFVARKVDEAESASEQGLLLADIRRVFTKSGGSSVFSSRLAELLWALPDRPWAQANRNGTPISEKWLAVRLLGLRIRTRVVCIKGRRARGYRLADFASAFERYLAEGTDR
jgi:putative DNA primase/helicase